jgi:molybdopterin-guanine dinucleotide biosynthesis protein A
MRGAILTGGRSSRMGRTKALIEVDGSAMATRVAAALAAGGCHPVVLVGGDLDELDGLGMPLVPDVRPGEGPLGGVLTAIELDPDRPVLVAACDLPHLTAEAVLAIAEGARTRPDAQVIVARSDRIEPACALWQPSARGILSEAFERGERAIHRVLQLLDAVEVDVDPEALRNINTPGDLDR